MKKRILITISVLLILCIGFAAFWYFTYLYKYNQGVEFRTQEASLKRRESSNILKL